MTDGGVRNLTSPEYTTLWGLNLFGRAKRGGTYVVGGGEVSPYAFYRSTIKYWTRTPTLDRPYCIGCIPTFAIALALVFAFGVANGTNICGVAPSDGEL